MPISADSLLISLNRVFDAKTQNNLRISIAELSVTMKEFSEASKNLNAIISGNKANLDGTLANLNKATGNFATLSDSLNNAKIGEAFKKLEKSLANVDKIVNDVQSGKGTIGKLLKDDGMYNNLEGASLEMKQLLADFKQNPKRYVHFSVFGKKPKPYVAPKEEVKDTIK